MQGSEKAAEPGRGITGVSRRSARGDLAGQERDDAPRPRVAKTRLASPDRDGDRQRQPRTDHRKPPLLIGGEPDGLLAPGHPDQQGRTKPEEDVVPPVRHRLNGEMRQIRVLHGQQPPHQVRGDAHLCNWHATRTHPATLVS